MGGGTQELFHGSGSGLHGRARWQNKEEGARDGMAANLKRGEAVRVLTPGDGPSRGEPNAEAGFDAGKDSFSGVEFHDDVQGTQTQAELMQSGFHHVARA